MYIESGQNKLKAFIVLLQPIATKHIQRKLLHYVQLGSAMEVIIVWVRNCLEIFFVVQHLLSILLLTDLSGRRN